MTTLEMEIALMQKFGVRQNIIVPNISWGMNLHECDLLSIAKSGYSTEIEIKISKADLLKDKKKSHQHRSDKIKYLYFAVPKNMVEFALENIPERAGLLSVEEYKKRYNFQSGHRFTVRTEKAPVKNKSAVAFSSEEILKISHLGCMRILTLKMKTIPRSEI